MSKEEKEFNIIEIGKPCFSKLDFELFCKFLYTNFKEDMYKCQAIIEGEQQIKQNNSTN